MLFDIKRIEFHSLAEFFREYVMIVVGILTALMMEHLVIHHHDEVAAEQSRDRLVNEIQMNISDIRSSEKRNEENVRELGNIAKVLAEDLRKGVSKQDINKHLSVVLDKDFHVDVNIPTLRHEAWDVVVADQSVTHISRDALARFASAYASQRDITYSLTGSTGVMAGHAVERLLDAGTDLEFHRADPYEFLKAVKELTGVIQSLQENLDDLRKDLDKAIAT